MTFLTRKVPWATWQFGILKISMITFGIILGALFHDFWKPLLWPIAAVAVVTGAWVTAIWIRAMRKSDEAENR